MAKRKSVTYRSLLRQAKELEQQNDLWGAVQKYDEAIELYPELSPAYYQQAILHSQIGNYEEAIKYFRKVIEINPDDATVYHNLGVLYYKKFDRGEAERLFLKAVEVDPDYLDPLYSLGKLYMEKNDTEKARAFFEKCGSFPPAQEELERLKSPPFPEREKTLNRILVIMEQGIGNMVMLTPALQALRNLYLDAEIIVLGREPALSVIRGWRVVDTATEVLPEGDFDVVLVTIWGEETFKQYQEQLRIRAKEIIRAETANPDVHESELHLQLVRKLGYQGETPQPFVVRKKADFHPRHQGRLVALADTSLHLSAWQRKRWPHFRELAKRLVEQGDTPVLIGGKAEAEEFNETEWPKEVINCLGKYDLQETADVLASCDMVVANDSGPAHIAAAVGVPTFVLFGPTRIQKNRPIGEQVTIITRSLDCRPCQYTSRWQQCHNWRCLSELSVDEVLSHLNQPGGGAALTKKHGAEESWDILIVGVLDVPSSTNVFMKKGFEQMGYRVDAYNYRTRARQLGSLEAMWEDFKGFLQGKSYRLILFCKVNGFHPDLITYAGKHGRTWYWFMDNVQVALAIGAGRFVKRADFASATSEEVAEYFKKFNPNSRQILEGFDPQVYFKEKGVRKKYDVVFVGNATEKRVAAIRQLKDSFRISVFGTGWPEDVQAGPPVYNDDLRKLINRSRVVLNFVHSNIFSDRVVLTAASGGFVLSEYCPDLERHFQRKKHLDWFVNLDEARALLQHYLDHPALRSKIAKNGMTYVREHFPWVSVCQKVLAVMDAAPLSETKANRILFVSWHGLGDNVMLTPALRKYKQLHPDHYVAVAGLRRFGQTLSQLLSGLWFVDQVIPELPDAWNDFSDYESGVRAVVRTAEEIARTRGFDRIVVLPTRRQSGYRLHKIFRFADEVGVSFEKFKELQTELSVTPEAEQRAEEFLKNFQKPVLIFHTKSGNSPKTLEEKMADELLNKYQDYTVLEFGRRSTRRSILVPEDDMEFSKALIKKADLVMAIDSVVMHIAGAFRKPLVAIFTRTPVHQAIPITYEVSLYGYDNEVTQLSRWKDYRQEIMQCYRVEQKQVSVVGDARAWHPWQDNGHGDAEWQDTNTVWKAPEQSPHINRVIVTGPGHGGTNWATEIIRTSDKFNFTEFVEDRRLFTYKSLPPGYATKLATENIGMYWENLKNLMLKHLDLGIVFITRHPVDNCLSKMIRSLPDRGDGKIQSIWEYSWDGTLKGSIKSIEFAYSLYKNLQETFPERVLRIKLENLILHQETEIEKICKFLNIPMNDSMFEAYKFTRNKHQQARYQKQLDVSQIEMYKRWESIYDGFFANKKNVVDFLLTHLKDITRAWEYQNGQEMQDRPGTLEAPLVIHRQPVVANTRTPARTKQKIKLPDFYYDPICYWAHMVTFRCNANCPYCILNGRGRHQRARELSGKEVLDFWNNVEHPAGQRLSIIGGEPTLHPDIVEIVNNLEGYHITLTTNCKGPFYSDPNFYKKFKPHPSSTLRINTTFHPHFISPEEYIRVINLYRKTGYFVDQTSYVYTPEVGQYREAIEKVSKEIPIKAAPYLGFYSNDEQFRAPFDPRNLEPNEEYYDNRAAATICGLTNYDAYRHMCGQYEKREAKCLHPLRSFIIGPDGNYYHCHYKLYYGIDPVSHVKRFKPVTEAATTCRHYGFCNWCDVPRVGCYPNQSARKMVLNKLYDKRELTRSEIQSLMQEIDRFSKIHSLEFNKLKWFEYSYCLLYSGHRHRGKVLDVGSAKSVFPYYLASKGYRVTTLDLGDSDFRNAVGKRFGVKSITADLREFQQQLEGTFDLISNLSVIEHIDEDSRAVLNLARYLKPGGIMVISTDFYERYIEYPDANRTIVVGKPAHSYTDSRVYTPETFMQRVIEPLEQAGMERLGLTDFENVDIHDPDERSVRGLYTFGVAILRKKTN